MASHPHRDPRRDPPGFARREFLTLGAAAALSPWLANLAGATPLGAGARRATGAVTPGLQQLSVGYLLDSDTHDRCGELFGRPVLARGSATGTRPLEVVPATGVEPAEGLADALLRVRVVGLYPGVPEVEGPDSVNLDVLFRSPDPEVPGPLAFHAWSYRTGSAPMVASPVGFAAVPDRVGGLMLELTVQPGANGGAGHAIRDRSGAVRPPAVWRAASLATTGPAELPRLRRGLYLLGVEGEAWDRVTILPPVPEPWRVETLSVVVTIERAL